MNHAKKLQRAGVIDEEQPIGIATAACADILVPFSQDRLETNGIVCRIDPGIDRDAIQFQTGGVADRHFVIDSIQTETLTDFARGKSRAVVRRTIVMTNDIVRISLSRPPTRHPRGWTGARWGHWNCR